MCSRQTCDEATKLSTDSKRPRHTPGAAPVALLARAAVYNFEGAALVTMLAYIKYAAQQMECRTQQH
jgi:hypothetical protein